MPSPTTRADVPFDINDNAVITSTISKPSGTAEGDVMYAVLSLGGQNETPALAGWTTIASQDRSFGRCSILRKVAGGAEPASYTFTWVSISQSVGCIVAVVGADTDAPEEANPTPTTGTSTDPDPPASGALPSKDYLALAIASQRRGDATYTPPSGYVEESDIANSSSSIASSSQSVASLEFTATSEDPGIFTSTRSEPWAAFTIIVAPPAVAVSGEEGLIGVQLDTQVVRNPDKMVGY